MTTEFGTVLGSVGIGQIEYAIKRPPKPPPKKEPAQSGLGKRPSAPSLPRPSDKERIVYGQG